MKHIQQKVGAGIVLILATALSGCGASTPAGGAPAPQPITSVTNPNSNSNTTPPTSTTKPSGGTTTGTSTSKGQGSTNVGTTTGTGKGSGSTTPASQSSGAGTSSIQLVAVPVSPVASGDMFVAAGTSVTTVMIPKGWSATGLAAPAGATFVRASNPGDSNQQVVEDIKSTAWDLQGFFSRLPSGAGQYLVPGQVVRYTIVNPNNPYPDEGIIANTSSGSIRVDVYLPKAERATADAILQSFIPQK